MKIILKKHIPNIGQENTVQEVKFGFGKNWLIPQGLAILATPSALLMVQKKQELIEAKKEQAKEQFSDTIKKLEKSALIIKAKVTEKDNLYSHITAKQIAEELKVQYNIEVDAKNIEIQDEIKHIGNYKINIVLTPELKTELKLEIKTEKPVSDKTTKNEDNKKDEKSKSKN